MKTLIAAAAGLMLAIGVQAAPETKKPEAAKKAQTLKVDPAASKIVWVGKKVTGSHTGTVPVKEGSFEVSPKDGKGKGEVVIDLSGLVVEDVKDPEYNKKLTDHLKHEDFFNVAKYPTATYKIESLKEIAGAKEGEPNALAKGKLTIRGVTKPYETKLVYTPSEEGAAIKGKLEIDRTQYGLKYNSKKFFDAKALGDKLIDDKFEVDLDLVAKK